MPTPEQRPSKARVDLDYVSISHVSWGLCVYTETKWLLEMKFTVKTMKLSPSWERFHNKILITDERVLKND